MKMWNVYVKSIGFVVASDHKIFWQNYASNIDSLLSSIWESPEFFRDVSFHVKFGYMWCCDFGINI